MSNPPTMPIALAFARIVDLARAVGAKCPLDKYAQCWEYDIDEHWHISANGHREEKQDSEGLGVPPFSCYVRFNGWPAGVISPFSGMIVTDRVTNEDAFIEAIENRIAQERLSQ